MLILNTPYTFNIPNFNVHATLCFLWADFYKPPVGLFFEVFLLYKYILFDLFSRKTRRLVGNCAYHIKFHPTSQVCDLFVLRGKTFSTAFSYGFNISNHMQRQSFQNKKKLLSKSKFSKSNQSQKKFYLKQTQTVIC